MTQMNQKINKIWKVVATFNTIELANAFVKAGVDGQPIMKQVYENVKSYDEKDVEQEQSKYPNAERFLNNWEKVLRVKDIKPTAEEE